MNPMIGLSGILFHPLVLWGLATWLAMAIFAGYVASQKGRCTWCWFVWGLVFGPVSLIASAGLPPLVQVVRGTVTASTPVVPSDVQ
jgi:hypothetical protein